MPDVQSSLNVRCESLHVCLFLYGCVVRSVRKIFTYLETSHDEILILYKGTGIVFS